MKHKHYKQYYATQITNIKHIRYCVTENTTNIKHGENIPSIRTISKIEF